MANLPGRRFNQTYIHAYYMYIYRAVHIDPINDFRYDEKYRKNIEYINIVTL